MQTQEDLARQFEDHRERLRGVAYRMLGSTAEAEDVVQETWLRLSRSDTSDVRNLGAWLTTVAGRICLDVLSSARVHREQYVGPWLPEPVPTNAFVTGGDPLDRVTLDDTVSSALLVVLESMTPAERVAFVLHEVFALPFPEIAEIVGRSPAACRQLATSARRRVQRSPIRTVSREGECCAPTCPAPRPSTSSRRTREFRSANSRMCVASACSLLRRDALDRFGHAAVYSSVLTRVFRFPGPAGPLRRLLSQFPSCH